MPLGVTRKLCQELPGLFVHCIHGLGHGAMASGVLLAMSHGALARTKRRKTAGVGIFGRWIWYNYCNYNICIRIWYIYIVQLYDIYIYSTIVPYVIFIDVYIYINTHIYIHIYSSIWQEHMCYLFLTYSGGFPHLEHVGFRTGHA